MDVARPGHHAGAPLSKAEKEEYGLRTRQAFLAIGMLVSGTCNTLTCKAAMDVVSAGGAFDHPFLMAACMFSGETLCLVLHEAGRLVCRRRSSARVATHVPKHIFVLPALCDILGTSIMYVGLTMTAASVYQVTVAALRRCDAAWPRHTPWTPSDRVHAVAEFRCAAAVSPAVGRLACGRCCAAP